MATSQMSKVVQHLRSTLLQREGAGLTDGQLLGCFIEHRDEAAFAALVRRHGPMVWGVCRRLLNQHDAEDAFQAAFLVLFRKAASIQPREMLANWLYGVVHQAALQARRTTTRRRAREKQVTEMPEPAAAEQDLWDDLRPLLDQELSRLPDKYRTALVLCDLEGKTRKEAARQLGLPEGTVASRLMRARAMLAKRLSQRGVMVSGGVLAAVLSQNVSAAGVPTSVVSSTIKAASLFAAGQAAGVISVKVAALTEGVLRTMFVNKFKAVIAALLVLGLLATGAAVLTCRVAAAHSDKPIVAGDKPPTKKDGGTAKAGKRSGYLVLNNIDLVKGFIKGDAIRTNDERTIYSYGQETWQLKVGPTTKIIIDGKETKLADLRTIRPEPHSSGGWMTIVFVEWEEIAADQQARVKKGAAIRVEGKGVQVRGIIQAKKPGKNTLSIKRIHQGFSGDFVAEKVSEINVAKDVYVKIDHKAAAFNDLKPGMKVTLQVSAVKELVLGIKAYGAKVDGVIKSVNSEKNTVSVNILSAQMTAERVPVAKDAKVVIDGKEGKLSDLRAGMRVTLQMSAEPEESLIVSVTKDKTAGNE